jgi:hypothetical protein
MLVACFAVGNTPGDIKEDFLILRALKRERCWPFAGSQDRVPLVVYLVFTGGQATVMWNWISLFSTDSQARVLPVVLR